ncbi:armadillo-type protein [Cladochytrium replicatum]|nr:armadillo-type protein [Cladochytrium replicatum]
MSSSPFFPSFPSVVGPTPPAQVPESFNVDDLEKKIAVADSPEKRELVVYQWLMTVEKDIKKNSKETLRPYQSNIEKALIRFLGSSSPKPTKPIRQLIARCMVGIYSGSDTRTLFDTIVAIQNLINGKKDLDPAIRRAAIHCIGVVTEAVGGKVLSLFGETTSTLLKIIRSTKEAELPLRFETLTALARSLRGAGKGASDSLIKDVIKLAKASLTDKTCLIRSCGAELLEAIYKSTSQSPPVKYDEYESLVTLGLKALDGGNYATRRSVASLLSSVLLLSQQPAPITKGSPKRNAKANEADAASQPQSILSITEMLNALSTPLLKTSTREVRVGIVETYASLFRGMGIKLVETNYPVILRHLLENFGSAKITSSDNDCVESRTYCNFLLREVIGKSLTESGQISAIKDLASDWLRKWPAVLASDVAPSKVSLTCALNEAAALMHDLGSTAQLVQDSIVEPAMPLLSHTAPSVNTALAIYFKAVCLSLPSNLPRLMSRMISLIQKDLPNLASDKPDMLDRYVGYGNVLATLTSVIPQRSLYISFDTTAKVFGLANQLLKAASVNKDLHVAATQSQVAWALISGLLTLGPSFVRVHSAQLMLLWKNVLQKPSSKDGHKGESDWYHAITVRETALGALECFLTHNAELLTSDVSKRIVVNLNNTMTFVNLLPTTYPQPSAGLGPGRIRVRLQDRDLLLRKKLFQCFKAISSPTLYEGSHSSVLRATMDVFAPDPERGQPEKPQSNTVDKTGGTVDATYTTSLLNGLQVEVAGVIGVEDRGIARALIRETDVQIVETLLTARHMGAIEYDSSLLLRKVSPGSRFGAYGEDARAQIPTVAAVDAAAELFSQVLPLQSNAMQESILDQLVKVHKYQGGKMSVGRRNAAQLNILVALIGALKYIMAKKGTLGAGRTPQLIWEIAEDQLLGSDHGVRLAACEMVGRLARVGGSASAVNPLIQSLVDQVVKNRDPDRRASSALALGYIHSYVGGMAAGSHLKTIVGLLHTLATDPYPLVHTWALHSLWLTIESAGLMYGPFVNSTLSVVAKLFMSESHEPTAPLANVPGSDSEAGAYPIFGRILHALLGVVGPELQSSSKMRDLFFNLYEELKNDTDPFVVVEAIRCIQHFILFASQYVEISSIIPFLQLQLQNEHTTQIGLIRKAAVTCLYQLVQRSPEAVLGAAVNNQLEEQLFSLLDTETDPVVRDEIRDILVTLEKHTAPEHPSRWLDLCKGILSRSASRTVAQSQTTGQSPTKDGQNTEEDEEAFEVEGGEPVKPAAVTIAGSTPQASSGPSTTTVVSLIVSLTPRWRTQLFALTCVRQILNIVASTSHGEHFDLAAAKAAVNATPAGGNVDFLILRLPDLIRLAFGAATSNVNDLRLEGLNLLKDILDRFSATKDPDYEGHALLEQYQAQISAALTPAFATESPPEITSEACRVCAVYIGSGINKDLSTLGRVLKFLSVLLDNCKDESNTNNEETHIQVMLRLSVLLAWAELCIASTRHPFLEEILKPNLATLARLWVSLLNDYAKMRLDFELDTLQLYSGVSSSASGGSTQLDSYISATREVLLPYYNQTWLVVMQALTSLIDVHDSLVTTIFRFDLNTDTEEEDPGALGRSSKVFKVLLGICIEAISNSGLGGTSVIGPNGIRRPSTNVSASRSANASGTAGFSWRGDTTTLEICLESIKKLVRPHVLGQGFIDKAVFLELIHVFDRVIQTEDVPIQTLVLRIVNQLIVDYKDDLVSSHYDIEPSSPVNPGFANGVSGDAEAIWTSISNQRLYVTIRLLYNVSTYHIPSLSNNPTATFMAYRPQTPETAVLLGLAIESLTSIILLPSVLESHTAALIPLAFYIFISILETEKFSNDVSPRVIICLKRLLDQLQSNPLLSVSKSVYAHVLQASVCSLLEGLSPESDEVAEVDAISEQDLAWTKNTLLSIVLITATCPALSHNPSNQSSLIAALRRYIQSKHTQLSLAALQCVRTLLPITGRSEPAVANVGATYAVQLLPTVVLRVLELSEKIKTSSGRVASDQVLIAEEALRVLLLLYTTVTKEEKKPAMLAIIIPAFISVLFEKPVATLPTSTRNLHTLATQTLLQLASAQPLLFKKSVAHISGAARNKLEQSFKSLISGNSESSQLSHHSAGADTITAAQPKITLKSFS